MMLLCRWQEKIMPSFLISTSSVSSQSDLQAFLQLLNWVWLCPHMIVIALCLWLGVPLFLCTCLSVIDYFGDHLLGCSYGPLRIHHHDALVTAAHHALLQDHPSVLREHVNCFFLLVPSLGHLSSWLSCLLWLLCQIHNWPCFFIFSVATQARAWR